MTRAKPDALLPIAVKNLPAHFVFQADGLVRPRFQECLDQGVICIIAGPEKCDVVIDIKRPYFRPEYANTKTATMEIENHV